MSKNRRLQIPVSPEEEALYKKAAKVFEVSTAEWVRRVLRKAAHRDIAVEQQLDPLEAIEKLANLKGPISEIQKMKQESIKGRLL